MEKKCLFKTVRNSHGLTMCSKVVKDSRYLTATPIGYFHISSDRGLALGVAETTCLDCLKKFLRYNRINKQLVQERIATLEKIGGLLDAGKLSR